MVERKSTQAQRSKAFDEIHWAATLDWLILNGLLLATLVAASAQTAQADSKKSRESNL